MESIEKPHIVIERERKWEEEAKREAERLEFELLTPAAAAKLFGKSMPNVRRAGREQRIETVFTVSYPGGKEVRLYSLRSCIEFWHKPDSGDLDIMRLNGHILFVSNTDGNGGLRYNVLNTEPFLKE